MDIELKTRPSQAKPASGVRTGNGRQSSRKAVTLALQGGGAHGAFTWGVLDRLLEDPDFAIEGITGTSAGAMNAVVLADGLSRGGNKAARDALRMFWEAVGRMPGIASLAGIFPGFRSQRLEYSPVYLWFDLMTRLWSPYKTNPMNYNPLRDLLSRSIDFERLRHADGPCVFVCATNVRTGRRKVFAKDSLSVDAVLASACLPHMFQAVEIDGEAYWDGGYSGNPAIIPLYRSTRSTDMIIIGINPLVRREIPWTARGIVNRVNEITFNIAFLLELEAATMFLELFEKENIDPQKYRRLFLHGINAEAELSQLGASSKLNNRLSFLHHLHDIGWRAAEEWMTANAAAVGRRTTLDYGPRAL